MSQRGFCKDRQLSLNIVDSDATVSAFNTMCEYLQHPKYSPSRFV